MYKEIRSSSGEVTQTVLKFDQAWHTNTGISEELQVPYMAEDIQYERKWRKYAATIGRQRLRLFAFHCHPRWRRNLGKGGKATVERPRATLRSRETGLNKLKPSSFIIYVYHTYLCTP